MFHSLFFFILPRSMRSFSTGRRSSPVISLMSLCLWAVPLLYLFYSLWIIFFVTGHSNEALREYYVRNWPDAFDAETVSRTCFTPVWDAWIGAHKGLIIGGIALTGAGYLGLSRRVLRWIRGALTELGQGFRWMSETFWGCSPAEKGRLLGLFGVLGLYWVYLFANSPLFQIIISY